jgi:succinyl-diaminopimelate desuccinylase
MDYVKVLSDLIAIDTAVPPGHNYERAIDFLTPFFQQAGFTAEKVAIPPPEAEGREGRVSLVAHRRRPGKPRLIFYGHVDVVPAGGWDAFSPRLEGGKLYGRGAADMKGGIVALLMALEGLKGKPLKYDLSVTITVDEELSQATQLRYLTGYLEPVKGAQVFSLDSNFGYVAVAGLGALQLEIKVKGKSVHSGLSHLGVNAIEEAVPILNALLTLKEKVVQRRSRVKASPDTGLEFMVPRLNINMIHGGLKVNIVPDECVIQVDRRLLPEETLAEAEKELLDTLAAAAPEAGWQATKLMSIRPLSPAHGALIDKLDGVIKKVAGESGQYGEMGSGDLGVIVLDEWQGEEFGVGVIRTECNIHGKNEFVYTKDIVMLADIIREFIRA